MTSFNPTVYTGTTGSTLSVGTIPDRKNGIILLSFGAWVIGNIPPNDPPDINWMKGTRNSVDFTQAAFQKEDGMLGETATNKIASWSGYLANPDPGTYSINLVVSASNYTSFGVYGKIAAYVYNAEYDSGKSDWSGGVGWPYTAISGQLKWTSIAPRSFSIGSCLVDNYGSAKNPVTAVNSGSGVKIDVYSNSTGQAALWGGGDTVQHDFSWSGAAPFSAAGVAVKSKGVIPRLF